MISLFSLMMTTPNISSTILVKRMTEILSVLSMNVVTISENMQMRAKTVPIFRNTEYFFRQFQNYS
jgi:Mrp family chromosome partitioning ATPase